MKENSAPWRWVPSAYLAQGIPYAVVSLVGGSLLKDLGHSDGEITTATAAILVVWSLKPLWADLLNWAPSKRSIVVACECIAAAALVAAGMALSSPHYFAWLICLLSLFALMGATQDICIDGLYVNQLSVGAQSRYIGVQGMAWNLGRIVGGASMLSCAGWLQTAGASPQSAWRWALFLGAGLLLLLALYHYFQLPVEQARSRPALSWGRVVASLQESGADFCNRRQLWGMLAFVFCFRSAEGLLLGEAPLFMQAPLAEGGLGLSLQQKGLLEGTLATFATIAGGLLGGVFVARYSLRRSLFFLALCVNIPNLCYVYLSHAVSPDVALPFTELALIVSIEKFGYGFGFVANMLYMIQQLAVGRFRMVHYAFATALMNLVLVPVQMISGPLADHLGYKSFFLVVMLATLPSLVAAWFAPFPQTSDSPVDEREDLSAVDVELQARTRQASIAGLLGLAVFLLFDVQVLGFLSRLQSPAWRQVLLTGLTLSACLKVWLGGKALISGIGSWRYALASGSESPYKSNAVGASLAGGLCITVAFALLVYVSQ